MRKQKVLLSFVEAVNFIDKNNRVLLVKRKPF
jgi:hypothetical protein